MLPRERVIETINHGKPDRVPIYAWLFANLNDQVTEAFGSIAAFEDKYEFDYAHLFGGPGTFRGEDLDAVRDEPGAPITPAALLDVPLCDPNDEAAYQGIKDAIRHHKDERGRFVLVQTNGIFEALNGVFGIESHLLYLALYEKELHEVYRRQAEWNRAFATNCIDLGIDMVHVSDDWGTERSLMFSPETWWKLIHPYHKITCDEVRRRGVFLSLHCDGHFLPVVDGVIDLGYQVVHPWQESAGMDLAVFKAKYRDRLTVMGGLDVQTTIGFGDTDRLRSEIERVLRMFADGGLLFCTTHFVQDHCTMDELAFAYDLAYKLVREL